jgi:hypothetical protein
MRFADILSRGALWLGSCVLLTGAVDYDREVRPILSENCFQCHGQDEKRRMAGVRLDVDGVAPARVLARITADGARRMPPASSNRSLNAGQIALLKRWIGEGGKHARHWSFVPPVRPPVPAGTEREPIDAFVRVRLQAEGLHPAPAASPAAWLRRVSLDLTGLPPTLAELDAFHPRNEAAYEVVVDRLLASPAYGERMAMDWMDVARYADTHGFNNDAERSMWRWRDWVIAAFNSNMPYDRFLTEQLAGDLLPNATLNQRIATGFGRNHVINSEGGIIEEEYRAGYVADRVRTLGMAWLGLTVECAHCHDHKFDPISQRDHYSLAAFFNNLAEPGEDGRVGNSPPMIPAPTEEQQQRMAALQKAIAKLPPSVGKSAAPGGEAGQPVGAEPVPLSRRDAFSIGLRLQPAGSDKDVALLSALDYSQNPAAASYGQGLELRLVDGELEFRSSQRFPAYSIRLRSEGAGLTAGHSRYVTLVYSGTTDPKENRARAAWVSIFVDGLEVPTVVLNDGLGVPDVGAKPTPLKFRIGSDNALNSAKFAGTLSEITLWNRAVGFPQTERGKLRAELLALRRNAPTVMVMQEMAVPRETHILIRGSYDAPGEKVDPGVPEALLGAWPAGAPRNRLGLAQWLTKPDHPLTSRVVVNRFWQQFFGQGIVKTSDNFGLQGEFPSHPELLDWLARKFIDSGWNVKALMKRMVLSATYRQDSAAPQELIAKDPENRLLARGPRFRLPAEVIRDQALQAAGLLKQKVGGPGVYPYQQADLYKGIVVAANYPGTVWTESKGDDLYRRSLYTFWKRTVPNPTMSVFDAPDREVCIVRRNSTNTPLQALTLLNDTVFVEAARKLAERVIHEGGTTPAARLTWAFRLAAGRAPNAQELSALRKSLTEMQAGYKSDEIGARALLAIGASQPDATIPVTELAAYTAVMNVILNLDEVITKG